MSRLASLKSATSLHDLGHILGYTAKGLAYILHGVPDTAKYSEFTIKKRSGGSRVISAPIPELKRLQQHLASLLNDCMVESDANRGVVNTLSHGFRPKHSIMTNAAMHRKHRYVFNLDLKDFFDTINFGRVWKFFEKNREFGLNTAMARTIAQIACHKGTLPQGSPSSPVISNLIAHILDIAMVQLAAKAKCHYSRYADDLTFSTNESEFPGLIATRIGTTTEWAIAPKVVREIVRCGFQVNPLKTRMQYKTRRQDVTGIVVNTKVNIRSEYSRDVRAKVSSLITKDTFSINKTFRNDTGAWTTETKDGTDAQLRGMLSFIDSVRLFERRRNEQIPPETHIPRIELKEMDGNLRVYRAFLLFTQFYRPVRPLIICEGKTDNVYVRCALHSLAAAHPMLAKTTGKISECLIDFFSYSKTSDRVLHLAGGTGDLGNFIANYANEFSRFKKIYSRNPVIILIDNDSGSSKIFSVIKKVTESTVNVDGSLKFYPIKDNLYVVPIPKIGGKETTIEHFFTKKILGTKLNGKVFSGTDKFDPATQYGKHLFAEYVIKKNKDDINFSKFSIILKNIEAALKFHYGMP